MCPGEEFLPQPPDPDDIIYDDPDSNHGNEEPAEGGGSAGNDENPTQEALPTITETTPTTNTGVEESTDSNND